MATHRVSIRETRQRLRRLLEQVQSGDEIVVLRRGVEVGRLLPPKRKPGDLPDLSDFRRSIKLRGRALSEEIEQARRNSRY